MNTATIYSIRCKDKTITKRYYGSTMSFKHRARNHKYNCLNDNSNAYERELYQYIRNNGGWSNWFIHIEVELGFTLDQTVKEVERCLNCDIQTVFAANLCIECDACIDVCPVDCLTITENGDEDDLRTRLTAPAENLEEDLYVSEPLPQTSRVMVKDEDLCVHCGLCAERCPTGAWDMQKSTILLPHVKDELEASRVKKASNS